MQEPQEMQVWSLNQEDPLEKEMGTHSSNTCLEYSMDGGVWRATLHGIRELDTPEHTCMVDVVLPITSYKSLWLYTCVTDAFCSTMSKLYHNIVKKLYFNKN